MADFENPTVDAAAEKKRIKDERKSLKAEEKKQRQEIKKRAKEIAKRESELAEEDDKGGGVSSFVVTTVIVLVWIAILCFLIKLDVGGFGSEILTPLFKDVPVINLILPDSARVETPTETEEYGGYTNLKDAVDYIKVLELELEHAQTVNNTYAEELTKLQAEVDRLQEFEHMQVEFQRIKEQFYEEIVYADNGPGADAYRKYYESMDPTTAEALYKQVVTKLEEEKEVLEYVSIYSQMKAKKAGAIFDEMVATDSKLLARVLTIMDPDAAAQILANMQPANAAILTKIMYPGG
ncbi:MAG: hypothetical protein K6E32_02915 [Lachnospiraceae bacterium]|nr:hypothetical protein [Lachnospiraceae bacterium]